jgi:hypothetical protein
MTSSSLPGFYSPVHSGPDSLVPILVMMRKFARHQHGAANAVIPIVVTRQNAANVRIQLRELVFSSLGRGIELGKGGLACGMDSGVDIGMSARLITASRFQAKALDSSTSSER